MSHARGAAPAVAICRHGPCNIAFLRSSREPEIADPPRAMHSPSPLPTSDGFSDCAATPPRALSMSPLPSASGAPARRCHPVSGRGPAASETTTEREQDGGGTQPGQAAWPMPVFPHLPQAWLFRRPVASPTGLILTEALPGRYHRLQITAGLRGSERAGSLLTVTQLCGLPVQCSFYP